MARVRNDELAAQACIGAAPAGHWEYPAGRHWGVTRQTLLLDVKQALVDEFVDAERAQLAAKAGALGAAERQVRPLACRGVYVGHADLQLLGDLDCPLL